MSHDAAAAKHESHVPAYMKVFGALLVLTAVTVGVSYVHFQPPWGLVVGLAIAWTKATLVAAYFMHLKWEKALIGYLLGLTAFFAVVLFVLPIIDASWTAGVSGPPVGAPKAAAASPADHH